MSEDNILKVYNKLPDDLRKATTVDDFRSWMSDPVNREKYWKKEGLNKKSSLAEFSTWLGFEDSGAANTPSETSTVSTAPAAAKSATELPKYVTDVVEQRRKANQERAETTKQSGPEELPGYITDLAGDYAKRKQIKTELDAELAQRKEIAQRKRQEEDLRRSAELSKATGGASNVAAENVVQFTAEDTAPWQDAAYRKAKVRGELERDFISKYGANENLRNEYLQKIDPNGTDSPEFGELDPITAEVEVVRNKVFSEDPINTGLKLVNFDTDYLDRTISDVNKGAVAVKGFGAYSNVANSYLSQVESRLKADLGLDDDWAKQYKAAVDILNDETKVGTEEYQQAEIFYNNIRANESFNEYIAVVDKYVNEEKKFKATMASNQAYSDFRETADKRQAQIDNHARLYYDYANAKTDEDRDRIRQKITVQQGSLNIVDPLQLFVTQKAIDFANIAVGASSMFLNAIPGEGFGLGDILTDLSLSLDRVKERNPLPSNATMGVFANTTMFEGKIVQLDEKGDVVSVRDKNGFNTMVFPEFIDRFEKSGAAKNAKIKYTNLASTTSAMANGAVDLAATVLLTRGFGGLMGAGRTGATILGMDAGTAAQTAAIVTQYGGTFYKDALKESGDANASALYAMGVTAGMGLASSVFPLEQALAGIGGKGLASSFGAKSLGSLIKLNPKEAAKVTVKNILNYTGNMLKQGGGEAIEESFLEKIPEYSVATVFNAATGTEMQNSWTLEGAMNDAVLGFGIGTLGGVVLGGIQRNDYSKLAFYHAVNDPDILEEYRDYAASPEEFDALVERVDRARYEYGLLAPLVENAHEYEKVELANLIDQRNVLDEYVKSLGDKAPKAKVEELKEVQGKLDKLIETDRLKRRADNMAQRDADIKRQKAEGAEYRYYEEGGKYYKQLGEGDPEEISRSYFVDVTEAIEFVRRQKDAEKNAEPAQEPVTTEETVQQPVAPTTETAAEPATVPQDRQSIIDYTVDYQGVQGRLEQIDGDYYVRSTDGELTLVEGGLSDATNEGLGITPVSPPVVEETPRGAEVATDFDNSTVTITREGKSKTYTYDSVNTDANGNTISVNLTNDKGEKVTIRNPDVINEIEYQKVLFEINQRNYEPTIADIESEAVAQGIELAGDVEQVQQERPSADTERVVEEADPATPRVGDKYTDDSGNSYEITGVSDEDVNKPTKYRIRRTDANGGKSTLIMTPEKIQEAMRSRRFSKEGGIAPESRQSVRKQTSVDVLITPATVRSFNTETMRLKRLTDEYSKVASEIANGDLKNEGRFIELQNEILENYQNDIEQKVKGIRGVEVEFNPPYIGSWGGSYEPSLNMRLFVGDNADTQTLSNLLFDIAENTSQDAFILEQNSSITDRIPLTEVGDDGSTHYPQVRVTFNKQLTVREKSLIAKKLNEEKITEFSIDGDYFIVSLIDFSTEDINLKQKNYEKSWNTIVTLFKREGGQIGANRVKGFERNIRSSRYVGARNEGDAQAQTREYDRRDLFEAFIDVVSPESRQFGEQVAETVTEPVESRQAEGASTAAVVESDQFSSVDATTNAIRVAASENPMRIVEKDGRGVITGGIIKLMVAAQKGNEIKDVKTPSSLKFLPKRLTLIHLARNSDDKNNILKNGFDLSQTSISSPIKGAYFSSEDWSTMDLFNRTTENALYVDIDNKGLLYFDSAISFSDYLKENNLPYSGEVLTDKQIQILKNKGVRGILLREDFASQSRNELIVIDESIIKTISESPKEVTKLPSSFSSIQSISEEYHKAKKDGSNPELVEAVEEMLGRPTGQEAFTAAKADTDATKNNPTRVKIAGKVLSFPPLNDLIKRLRNEPIERLSQENEQARRESGEINGAATIVAAAVHKTIQEERGVSEPNVYSKTKQLEEQALGAFAEANGLMMELPAGERVGGGNEADVYMDTDGTHVIKVNNNNNYGTWLELLDGIAIGNALNPGTAYEVLGFTRNQDGEFSIVVRQRLIQGSPAAYADIVADLEAKGYEVYGDVEDGSFLNKEAGILIEDMKPANVFTDADGTLFYIDGNYLPYTAQRGGNVVTELPALSEPAAEPDTITTTLPDGKKERTYIKVGDKWYVAKKDGTPSKTEIKKEQFITDLNQKLNAIQERSTEEMVQREPGEVGQEGSGEVEQGEQGQEATQTEAQAVEQTAEETATENRMQGKAIIEPTVTPTPLPRAARDKLDSLLGGNKRKGAGTQDVAAARSPLAEDLSAAERRAAVIEYLTRLIASNPTIDLPALIAEYGGREFFPSTKQLYDIRDRLNRMALAERLSIAIVDYVPETGVEHAGFTRTEEGWVDSGGNLLNDDLQTAVTKGYLADKLTVDALMSNVMAMQQEIEEKVPDAAQPGAVFNPETVETVKARMSKETSDVKRRLLNNLQTVMEALTDVIPNFQVMVFDVGMDYEAFASSLGASVSPTDGGGYFRLPDGRRVLAINMQYAREWDPFHEAVHAYISDVLNMDVEAMRILQSSLRDLYTSTKLEFKEKGTTDKTRPLDERAVGAGGNVVAYLLDFSRRYGDASPDVQGTELITELIALLSADKVEVSGKNYWPVRVVKKFARKLWNFIFGKRTGSFYIDNAGGALQFMEAVAAGIRGGGPSYALIQKRGDYQMVSLKKVKNVPKSENPTQVEIMASKNHENNRDVKAAIFDYIEREGTHANKEMLIQAAMAVSGTITRTQLERKFAEVLTPEKAAESYSDNKNLIRGSTKDVKLFMRKAGVEFDGANEILMHDVGLEIVNILENKETELSSLAMQEVREKLVNNGWISLRDQTKVFMMLSEAMDQKNAIDSKLMVLLNGREGLPPTMDIKRLMDEKARKLDEIAELTELYADIGSAAGTILSQRSKFLRENMYDPVLIVAAIERKARKLGKTDTKLKLSPEVKAALQGKAEEMKRLLDQVDALTEQSHMEKMEGIEQLANEALDTVLKTAGRLFRFEDGLKKFQDEYKKILQSSRTHGGVLDNEHYRNLVAEMAAAYWAEQGQNKTAREVADHIASITPGQIDSTQVLMSLLTYSKTAESRLKTKYRMDEEGVKTLRKNNRELNSILRSFEKEFIKYTRMPSAVDAIWLQKSMELFQKFADKFENLGQMDNLSHTTISDEVKRITDLFGTLSLTGVSPDAGQFAMVAEALSNIESALKTNVLDKQIADIRAATQALARGEVASLNRLMPSFDNRRLNSMISRKRSELALARAQLNKQAQDAVFDLSLSERSAFGKVWEQFAKRGAVNFMALTRTMKAMLDIGVIGNQANTLFNAGLLSGNRKMYKALFATNARIIGMAGKEFFGIVGAGMGLASRRDYRNEMVYERANAFVDELSSPSSPFYKTAHLMEKAGLDLARVGDLNSAEELYQSNMLNFWAPLRGAKIASEMHYTMFMNVIRMATFDAWYNSIKGPVSDNEMVQVAQAINTMTGRTKIEQGFQKGFVNAGQYVLFAPRLYLSQFKSVGLGLKAAGFATGYLTKGIKPDVNQEDMMPPSVVKFVLGTQVKAITSYAMLATLIGFMRSLWDDDEEIQHTWGIDLYRHSNGFLKAHFGDVSVEGLGGTGATLRTLNRAILAAAYDEEEKLEEDYVKDPHREKFYHNNQTAGDVLWAHFKNRTAPWLSAVRSIATGRDFMGVPYQEVYDIPGTAQLTALALAFSPIPAESFVDEIRRRPPGTDTDWIDASIVTGLNTLGLNAREVPKMQTFEAYNIVRKAKVGYPPAITSSLSDQIRNRKDIKFYFKEEFSQDVGKYIIENYGNRPDDWLKNNAELIKAEISAYSSYKRKELETKYLKYLEERKSK